MISRPFRNAVCLAFNDASLFAYLDLAYRVLIKKQYYPFKLTVVASCTVHVMKFFSAQIKEMPKELKTAIMLIFGKCVVADTYESFVDQFSDLYVVLNSKHVPHDLLTRISRPTKLLIDTDTALTGEEVDCRV